MRDTCFKDWSEAALHLVKSFAWGFNTFDDEHLVRMRRAVMNFAFDYLMAGTAHPEAKAPYWLTICGPSECGKTFLTHQLIRFLQQFRLHPSPASISKTPNRRLHANFFEANHLVHDSLGKGGQEFKLASDSDVLAVDDLGTDSGREAAVDVLYRLLSWRAEKGTLPGKWTVITSNLTPEQIGQLYDPRLESRIRRGKNRVLELPEKFTPYYSRK